MQLPEKLPLLSRAALALEPFARTDGTADPDRFTVAVSSEQAVPQYFGFEILDHSRSAIDLGRFKRGLPLRVVEDLGPGHYSGIQVGLVEEPELDEKARVLRGVARFGRSAKALEVKQDVEDRIRRFLSVSYRITKMVLESDDKDKGPIYRATRWTPHEVAIVPVPADVTVGFGRSAGAPTGELELVEVVVGASINLDAWSADRVDAIIGLARTYSLGRTKTLQLVESGRAIESIKAELLDLFWPRLTDA